MKPKVLVAIPYNDYKRYSIPHVLDFVKTLSDPDIDIEVLMRWDMGQYGGANNVKKQREYFRQAMLAGDYTHLYFLGCDTIPPSDMLRRMLSHNAPVVGGVYWGRHNADNGQPDNSVAWIHGMDRDKKELLMKSGDIVEVDGMGMDCVLFSRETMEKVSWLDWEQNDDDYPMYDKLKQLGYNIFIDTSIQCRHFFSYDGYSYLGEKYTIDS